MGKENSSEEVESASEEIETNAPSTVSEAEKIIDELKAEIAEIRRSHSSDRSKSDATIGELRAKIEEMEGYIDGVKKQFEKLRSRPKQSLVPPPPQLQTESNSGGTNAGSTQEFDESDIPPRKASAFRRFW